MKKSIFIFLSLFVLVFIYFFLFTNKTTTPLLVPSRGDVVINEKVFSVSIMDTATGRQNGLSHRRPLSSDEGMLFVFEKEGFYGFWMKDMLFSIDIIWIDANLKIVHIENNVSPQTYPKVFRPTSKSLYVLEILAGQSEISNIKIGDSVKILKK